ncbi:MAG: DUF1304 domain-containing protein [Planctomycetes bacterium]|nr:DUF1304 domain-containing protein [Planctomycetota bacterium]
MKILWRVLAGFGALFHLLAFLMESVLWMRPAVHARFGVDLAGAEAMRILFFNQGFYNLFLALGCVLGIALVGRKPTVGRTLVSFSCLSMAGAGLILAISAPEKLGAACMQGLPPLLAVVCGWRVWRLTPPTEAPTDPS